MKRESAEQLMKDCLQSYDLIFKFSVLDAFTFDYLHCSGRLWVGVIFKKQHE